MTFKFQEGDTVALKEDQSDYLPAGSRGTVFCQYHTTPPAYEVNFWDTAGELLGAIMCEDEIEATHQKVAPMEREAVGVA